jgi:hypothetical protein
MCGRGDGSAHVVLAIASVVDRHFDDVPPVALRSGIGRAFSDAQIAPANRARGGSRCLFVQIAAAA